MSGELQKAMAEFLSLLLQAVKAGQDVAVAQAPGVIREVVAYGRLVETLEVAVAVLAGGLCVVGACRLWAAATAYVPRDRYDDGHIPRYVAAVGCGIGAGAAGLIAAPIAESALKAWFAPRLYLLDWLKGMIQ